MENVDMGDVSEEDSNGSVIGKVMKKPVSKHVPYLVI